MKKSIFIILSMFLVACTLCACGSSSPTTTQDETPVTTLVKIRYGHQGMGVQRELFVAQEMGYFEANGIEVELVKLQSRDIASAITGGSIDAGGTSPIFALPAIVQGARMKAVLSSVQYNSPNSLPWICVLKDSPVQKPEDLDGKTVSGWERGSNLWLGIQEDYKEYGIEFSEYVGASTGQFQPMLFAGAVDAAVLYPSNYLIQYPDEIRKIIPMRSIAKFGSSATHWFSIDFIEEHPDAVQAFVDALQQAREFEKTNRDEVVELEAEFTGKSKDDILLGYELQSAILYPDEMILGIWNLKAEHDAMVEYGLLEEPINIDVFVDDRFATPVYEMPDGALDFLSDVSPK